MKKMRKILFGVLVVASYLMFFGCSDMNDIHQKYIDRAKTIYLGMTDSLTAYSGEGRVKLKWYVSSDPKIEQTVIYWNMRQDSIVRDFVRRETGVQSDSIIIDDLPEGTYFFELCNKNSKGHRSLYATVQGISYGEEYRSTLKNRTVASAKVLSYDSDQLSLDLELTWGPQIYGSKGMQIEYIKRTTGERVILFVDADETTTIVEDVGNRINSSEDLIEISTLYLLDSSIDALASYSQKEQICLYSASGQRSEYSSDGTLLGVVPYKDIVKILRRVSELSQVDIYDCNRVAELPTLSNTQFRIEILSSNKVTANGYFGGILNTLSTVENGEFSTEEYAITLTYKVLKGDGSFIIVEEEYLPASFSLPLVPDKVYSFGGESVGRLFAKDKDLLRLDESGNLWIYKLQSDNTFGTPVKIAEDWPYYTSIFYLPENRIFSFDGRDVFSTPIIDDNYNLGVTSRPGSGWHIYAVGIMPFKSQAILMNSDTGILRVIGVSQTNSWRDPVFGQVGLGFQDYLKIVPFENSIVAIDKSGNLWYMTLSDNYKLGEKTKLGSGWGKYVDMIKLDTSLLCLDSAGDLWSYEFNPDISWDIE